MSTNLEPIFDLRCSCNQYPWGKQGSQSISARLCAQQPGYDNDVDDDFIIDESKSYAELWAGTYPVLPSYVAATGEDLQEVIDRHPAELMGKSVMDKFGHSKLPFLPKVLSIAKALPLQLHPNKDLASKLHEEKPDDFTDPNHKPEIAVALSKFEAFCGFKPLASIAELLKLEPLKRFEPTDESREFDNERLRSVVKNMLEADDATVKETYKGLVSIPSENFGQDAYIPRLAPRLAEQYDESDPGILVALITMNYLVLEPGESIYIPADGIHAYLSGDIIECMARSNNVLNVGFCPRAERSNIDMFTRCLTFTPQSPEECMLRPRPYSKSRDGKTVEYAPPMSEFNMLRTSLKAGKNEGLGGVGGPSVLMVIRGSARMKSMNRSYGLKEGGVFFVEPNAALELDAGNGGLLMFTAFVE